MEYFITFVFVMDNNNIDTFLDGIFYYFGLIDNPAEKKAKEILNETPAQKIRKDVSKVNSSLKQSFSKIKQKALSCD